MKEISLSQNRTALIDDEDFRIVNLFSWGVGSAGYPMAYVGGGRRNQKMILMHNLILPPKPPLVIDHKNENKFDNQRYNLCYVTRSFNSRKKNNMGGVSRRGFKWRAYIDFCKVRKYLGSFDTEEEARSVHAVALKELEICKLIETNN